MLYEILTYKDAASFNEAARLRNTQTEAQHPEWGADKYWQVAGYKVNADGGLVVLWSRNTAATKGTK